MKKEEDIYDAVRRFREEHPESTLTNRDKQMNLTKERITALEQSLNEGGIEFAYEGDREDFVRLIEYWKSRQPKVRKHCGSDRGSHSWPGRCLPPRNPDTTYEEAP